MTTDPPPIEISYREADGSRSLRRIIPLGWYYAKDVPGFPGWLLEARNVMSGRIQFLVFKRIEFRGELTDPRA